MLQSRAETPLLQPFRRSAVGSNILLRVGASCLVAAATSVHYTDYGPLIPVMLKDLHITASQAGLMSTLLFLGLAVAYLPGGMLVDRFGQRPVLVWSLLLMTVGGVLLPLWPNIFWMLGWRVVIGLGAGAAFIAGAGVVAGVEKRAALAQGLYGGSLQVGSGLGLLLTPMISAYVGWQGTFLVWGLVGIPALVMWCFVRDGWEAKHESKVDVAAGMRSPTVWSLGLSHMGTFGVGNAIAAWISVYLIHTYNVSLGLAATFGALGLISGALFRPIGGWLLGHKVIGSINLLRVGTILTALGVVLLALPIHWSVLAALGMTSIAIGATIPYTSVFDSSAQLRTVGKGVAQGLLSIVACQTLLWCPPLIGLLYQQTGDFTLPFGVILLFSAVAIGASFFAGPAYRKEQR